MIRVTGATDSKMALEHLDLTGCTITQRIPWESDTQFKHDVHNKEGDLLCIITSGTYPAVSLWPPREVRRWTG